MCDYDNPTEPPDHFTVGLASGDVHPLDHVPGEHSPQISTQKMTRTTPDPSSTDDGACNGLWKRVGFSTSLPPLTRFAREVRSPLRQEHLRSHTAVAPCYPA